MSNPTPDIILPVLKGKKAVISYKLIPSDKGINLWRVMVGDKWLDKGGELRTLAECIALVHESAAAALGIPMDEGPPSMRKGQAVRVRIPGPMSIRTNKGQTRYSPTARLTLTRLTCDPYTRNGAHFVRVVGFHGEISCNEVEPA